MTSSEQKINDALERCLEHRISENDPHLKQHCLDCPELVEEVRKALRTLRNVERRFRVSVSSSRNRPGDGPQSTIVESVGHSILPAIPGYEILQELGRGGMGVVYKARQKKLDRVVALKMIRSGGERDATQIARFQTEAKLLAQLQHPNIVQLYHVGDFQGQPYLALEFVDGGNLKALFQKRELSFVGIASIIETLARAMHEAHRRNIVHRDLKPENVLLTQDGVPKIADFGLAKLVQLEPGSAATKSGTILGTPSYMSPEQAEGKIKEIGPRTDIYALGTVLFDGLTGRPPFREATAFATMLKIAEDDAPSPRTVEPKVPKDLEAICSKCLARKPEERFATAEELADRLKQFVQVHEKRRARRWATGSLLIRLAVLGVIVLSAMGLGVLLHMSIDRQIPAANSRLTEPEFKHLQSSPIVDPKQQYIDSFVKELVLANEALIDAHLSSSAGDTKTALLTAGKGLDMFNKASRAISISYDTKTTTKKGDQLINVLTEQSNFLTSCGLLGEYYEGVNFAKYRFSRIDPLIDCHYGYGSPAPGMPEDDFSIRWTGTIQAPSKGTYTITVAHDDEVMVWIDDRLIINKGDGEMPRWTSAECYLDDIPRKLKIEYNEIRNAALISLRWQLGDTGRQQVIPPSAFRPPASENDRGKPK